LRVVGDADAAGLRDPLQPRGDVDPVAKDIVVVDDDVTDMNADAEFDPVVLWHVGILPGHAALDFNRKARRIDCAGEFDQHAVAGRLDYPSAMRGDGGIDQGPSKRLQPGKRTFLVGAHETAISGDIRRQYSRKSPFHALFGQAAPEQFVSDTSKHDALLLG
jgi:hypothetical protein